MRSRNRGLAMFVAGAALLGACSSSGDSSVSTDAVTESTARSRNTLVAFGADGSGVAKNFIAPLKISVIADSVDQLQSDGSTILGAVVFTMSSKGEAISLVLQRLAQTDGAIDSKFGTLGKSEIPILDLIETSFAVTQNGSVVLATSIDGPDDTILGYTVERYIASTGKLDRRFGTAGKLSLQSSLPDSKGLVAIGEDNAGNLLVVDRVVNEASQLMENRVTRFKGNVIDETFGENTGSTVFGFDNSNENDVVQQQNDCRIFVYPTNKIDFLCTINELVKSSDSDSLFIARRGLQRVGFEANGKRSLVSADSKANSIWWRDAKRSKTALENLNITDIDRIDRVLSIVLGTPQGGNSIHVLLNREMVNENQADNGGNILFPNIVDAGLGDGNTQSLRDPRLISSAKPAIAGIYIDADRDEQGFIVSSFDKQAFISREPLSTYPFVLHTLNPIHLDASGQPNFSIDALGANVFIEKSPEITAVNRNSGFMALNTNGDARPEYAGGTSFVKSPILSVANIPTNEPAFPFEGALIAGNNEDFYALGGVWGDESALALKHFGGDGIQIGEVLVTKGLNFTPSFPLTAGNAVIDAGNNIYVSGIASMPGAKPDSEIFGTGVAKFSLDTGDVDTTFGENGFAFLQRIDPASSDNVEQDEWSDMTLVLQADGTIDVFDRSLIENDSDASLLDVEYRAKRISAAGDVGEMRQVLTPILDLPPELSEGLASAFFGATVDAQGRFVTSHLSSLTVPDPDGDDPADPTADDIATTKEVRFMKVTRYLADGSVDTSFGDNGVGGFRLDEVAFSIPLTFSQVRVQSDGKILVGFTGLDMSYTDQLMLAGEAHYLVRLTANGKLDQVTPPVISPEAQAARDAVPGLGVEQAPVVAPQVPAAIATSGNAQLAAAVDVPQYTSGDQLKITTLGVSADRAVAVKWAVPESQSERKLNYSVTASPSGRTCSTVSTTCVFKNLNPWTTYTFTVKVVSVAAVGALSSAKSAPVKPLRVVLRGSSTPTAKLITPASKGVQSWKVGGGCTLSKDNKTFTATPDGGVCSLSLTTAKSGKTPKTTRSISVLVKVVAK